MRKKSSFSFGLNKTTKNTQNCIKMAAVKGKVDTLKGHIPNIMSINIQIFNPLTLGGGGCRGVQHLKNSEKPTNHIKMPALGKKLTHLKKLSFVKCFSISLFNPIYVM